MTAMPPLDPALFHGLDPLRPHFCCGSEAPLPRAADAALSRYAAARATGPEGRRALEADKRRIKAEIAAFLGLPGGDCVAFAASTAHGLDLVLRAVDWRRGDNLVLRADDFPTVRLTGRGLAARGVEIRAATGGDDPEAALIAATDAKTRLVCVSHVDWRTGRRADLARLSEALRPRGITLVVDAAHSAGVLPIPAGCCDVLVSCGHKFLLGMHGLAVVGWREPPDAAAGDAALGWYALADMDGFVGGGAAAAVKAGADGFEPGNPAFLPILALGAGIGLLRDAGIDRIAAHAEALAAEFHAFLTARGIACLTPADPTRRGTSIAVPDPLGGVLARALTDAGLRVAHGVGRQRVSFHGFATAADLDRLIAATSAAL